MIIFRSDRFSLAFLAFSLLGLAEGFAQEAPPADTIVVQAEEAGSAYGAPPSLSRSRFSPTVTAYVLPPWVVYTGLIYEGDALHYDRPDHNFTQEVEMGLPGRFGVAFESAVEGYRGTWQERSASIEGRYAFADWDKIPFNPTIFAEYKFGIGNILHDEGPPMPLAPGEAQAFLNEHKPLPDAAEVRLLLSEDFGDRVEWALDFFFEQEVGGDRGREWGFAQSATIPILLPQERLKVGLEMQYTTFSDQGLRADPVEHPSRRVIIGPTIAFKPSHNTRFDVSPLFGITDDAPRASVFAVFSVLFGHEQGENAEAPASTRNR